MSYSLTRAGQQYGPYELDALRQMLANGQIAPTDFVWTEGMPAWVPVTQVLAPVPPPSYAAQPYSQPMPVVAGPVPPGMHWAVVFVLAGLTLGLFAAIWAFVEASFIKRISPHRNGRGLLFVILLINVVYVTVALLAWYDDHNSHLIWQRLSSMDAKIVMPALGYPLIPLLWVLGIVAVFRMRRGLLTYYNSTEPIQLRLSGFMTFFFSIYYFQHHLRRIAQWKKTGQLVPQ
jgi:hypothetical protein